MLLEELAVADAGLEEGNVALDIYWEILHLGDKLGSRGCMDGAVDNYALFCTSLFLSYFELWL